MLEEDSAESKSNKSKLFDAITEGKAVGLSIQQSNIRLDITQLTQSDVLIAPRNTRRTLMDFSRAIMCSTAR